MIIVYLDYLKKQTFKNHKANFYASAYFQSKIFFWMNNFEAYPKYNASLKFDQFFFLFVWHILTLDLSCHVWNVALYLAWYSILGAGLFGDTRLVSRRVLWQQFSDGNRSSEWCCSQCSCSVIMSYHPAVFCWHCLICWTLLEMTLTFSEG